MANANHLYVVNVVIVLSKGKNNLPTFVFNDITNITWKKAMPTISSLIVISFSGRYFL